MSLAILCLAAALAQTTTTPKTATTPKTTAAPKAAPKTAPAPKTAVKTTASPKTAVSPKTSVARKTVAPKPPAPMTDEEKTVYALGLSIYRSILSFDPTQADIEILQRALKDASLKQPAIEISEWGPKLQGLQQSRQARVAEKEKEKATAFLEQAGAELGALKTESGIVYRELAAGTGAAPLASDTVKVHYRGTLIDGTEFDSSFKRNEPAQFPLTQVIPCWTEGVQKMKVGGRARLVCPAALAYGDRGQGSIPGGAALIFEIELIEITTPK